MQTIVIAGGTGLIGTALSKKLLEQGYKVILLSRSAPTGTGTFENSGGIIKAYWNPAEQHIHQKCIEQADCIINLAGAGVADKRWTSKRKNEIAESRVMSGKLIVKALKEIPNKVQLVINSSGIGWYGQDPEIPNNRPFTEELPSSNDFLGETCQRWEDSIAPVTELGKRLVILRTAIVLSKDGGALREFLNPLRFGLATVLGGGKQIMSWIHIEDLCKMFLFAIEEKKINGIYNATSPGHLPHKQFITQLARKRNGNYYIKVPVPAFALKIVLGALSIEVLKSATVSPAKIESSGFNFHYPGIDDALQDLIR